MSTLNIIVPKFVEFIPKDLEEGVLYISIQYSTSVHKCACGCGSKIVLPINPTKWRLLWDGERISLWPSVGNWSYPCQSHYWIEKNCVTWAPRMSLEEIEANRARDRAEREWQLKLRGAPRNVRPPSHERAGSLFRRVRRLFRR